MKMNETVMETPTTNEHLQQKRFEVMLDMATKRLMNEVSTLKETMDKLTEEIQVLKNKVHRQGLMEEAKNVQIPQREQSEAKAEPQSEQPKEMKFTNSTNNEKITENDVSIEKIFYCGKK